VEDHCAARLSIAPHIRNLSKIRSLTRGAPRVCRVSVTPSLVGEATQSPLSGLPLDV